MSLALPAGGLDATLAAPVAEAKAYAPSSPRTPTGSPRCLIIVPAYNEGGTIARLIDRLQRTLPEMDVLVVDDGSTDQTGRAARALARSRTAEGGRVHTISLPFNVGIGGAMQTGYRYAEEHGYDIAIQVDGDGQHRPREVRKLVSYVAKGQTDLAVGSRFLKRQGYRQELPRAIGAWVLRMALRMLTRREITDCTSGFRAANRDVIRAFAHWYPEDYPEPEVILLLHRAGYRILETPVSMRQRRNGSSSISGLMGVFYVMKVTLCLVLDLARQPWDNGKVNRQ